MSKYWTRWAMRKQAGRPLTPEQLSKYMENPVRCPVCDSDNVSALDTLFMSRFDEAKQIHCATCGSKWVEDWTLTGAGDLEVRKLVTPEEESNMWEGQWQKRAEDSTALLRKWIDGNHNVCPNCGAHNLKASTLARHPDRVQQHIECKGCGTNWNASYHVEGGSAMDVHPTSTQKADEFEKGWEKRSEFNREYLEDLLMTAIFNVFRREGVLPEGRTDDAFWSGDLGTKYKEAENILIDIYLELGKQMGSDFEKQWS